ncbi:MAG TPA: hypothetical protein VHM89_04060, partial [Acidimicrobiales bacterium]|nr:hypothetical protein [Acidimicrobiales bacterium]
MAARRVAGVVAARRAEGGTRRVAAGARRGAGAPRVVGVVAARLAEAGARVSGLAAARRAAAGVAAR